ncbi:MAG: serine/threonine protein kinase [Planctomycetota bacterium]
MLVRVKRKGPLPVEEVVACILQAARGLGYAHQQGVTHRDIKPSNLLRDRQTGRVKILDMGLARVEEAEEDEDAVRLTMPGQMLGTARFMAPEQIEDARIADVRSDVYSLGCTMYYLLRGKAPYSGETVAHTLMAHVSAPIPDLCKKRSDVPDWLGDIFQKMLAKDPDDRFQKMSELVDEIQLHLGDQMSRRSSEHVLEDDEAIEDDEYSKLMSGRHDEGTSLASLYSEDEAAADKPGTGEFSAAGEPDAVEQLAAESPELENEPGTESARSFGQRFVDADEEDVELPDGDSEQAPALPMTAASPQSFQLPGEVDEPAAIDTAEDDGSSTGSRVGDYVRDKLKQRQDHQRNANQRVQLIASAVVGAAVMGLLVWIITR